MTKQAERPITVSFIEGSSCTFDSNDFVEFEILTPDLPMGEIVFKGSPFTDEGLTELGRCVFDYCDHGLSVYQELANMLYEAQHPWLDYADAVEKMVLTKRDLECVVKMQTLDLKRLNRFTYSVMPSTSMKELKSIQCFKPIKAFDFHHFNQVKVYTP